MSDWRWLAWAGDKERPFADRILHILVDKDASERLAALDFAKTYCNVSLRGRTVSRYRSDILAIQVETGRPAPGVCFYCIEKFALGKE